MAAPSETEEYGSERNGTERKVERKWRNVPLPFVDIFVHIAPTVHGTRTFQYGYIQRVRYMLRHATYIVDILMKYSVIVISFIIILCSRDDNDYLSNII